MITLFISICIVLLKNQPYNRPTYEEGGGGGVNPFETDRIDTYLTSSNQESDGNLYRYCKNFISNRTVTNFAFI